MDKTTAIEILELEIKTQRQRAEDALGLSKNTPLYFRRQREMLAKHLREKADALEFALNAIKAKE